MHNSLTQAFIHSLGLKSPKEMRIIWVLNHNIRCGSYQAYLKYYRQYRQSNTWARVKFLY